MQVRELLNNDDAVSPVIGVILMVAITVILAAVIASFVLGLGNTQSTTPTASFAFDYENPNSGSEDGSATDGVVTITHDGGDNIKVVEVFIRGEGFTSLSAAGGADGQSSPDMTSSGEWNGDASASIGDANAITAGDRVTVGVNSDYEVSVVWQAQEGSNSATLGSDKGPDA